MINMTDTRDNLKDDYKNYRWRKVVFILICIVLVFLMFFVSLGTGTLRLSFQQAMDYFFEHLNGVTFTDEDDIYNDNIIWNYRVPRALFAIIAGVSLAVSGTVMQSVMKNPLADPYTTGVSSGALFGVAVAIVLGLSVDGTYHGFGEVLNAILFSMIPITVIVIMAPFFRNSPASLILSGVAVSYLFNSFTSLLMVSTDSSTLAHIYQWQIGTLYDLSWDVVPLPFSMMLIGLVVLMPLAGRLNIMALDDKSAKSLGLDIEKLRILCLVLLALMTSVIISYVGIIGFVGLVIPHIIRIVLGADNKYLLPAAGAFGAVFLLGCDILGRSLDVSAVIPVGVVTSFIGAPLFLYIIIRQKRSMW